MSIATSTDINATDNKMLRPGGQVTTRHWLIDMGASGLALDEGMAQSASNTARCVGSRAPELVDGVVVIARCSRELVIAPSWTPVVVQGFSPLFLLCWQHGHQYKDFERMYGSLLAGE